MLLIKAINAHLAICQMLNKDMEYATAHALVMAKRELQPHAEFYSMEEMKIVSDYAVKDENGRVVLNGERFTFADPAKKAEYERRRMELGAVDIGEIVCRKAPPPNEITPLQLEALEGVIDFGGED